MKRKRIMSGALGLFAGAMMLAASFVQAATPVDFRDLVRNAGPAVVNISTERKQKTSQFPPGFEMFRRDPDIERFFDQFERFYNNPRIQKRTALGSGFVISSDGFIVTNNHVIEGADLIRVSFDEKSKEEAFTAEVVGSDPDTDLALLKIKASNLPFLKFGDSDKLEVGEWVLAIGNPLGLDHTVTAGIVSAKGRNIQSGSYDDFLQTDASINPGNSGGPLLNLAGEVVGINTAIAQRAQGIGFAIPSSMAERIIDDLQKRGKVSRGWLGVTIQNVNAATAKALGMKEAGGALVGDTFEGQPAAVAGIKAGDVIIAVNGERVADTEQLLRKVALLSPGGKASITVWRDGGEREINIVVAERNLKQAMGEKSEGETAAGKLGMQVRPVTPEDARRAMLDKPSGLAVLEVEEGSVAQEEGIQTGDVIVAVNKKVMNSPREFSVAVNGAMKEKGVLLLHISRKGHLFFRAIDFSKK